MNHRLALSASLVGFALLTSIGAFAYFVDKDSSDGPKTAPYVADFVSCANAGYPIQESYPRRCRAPDGRSFTEVVEDMPTMSKLLTLSEGNYGPTRASQKVITNEKDFYKLWIEVSKQTGQKIEQPTIDFSKQVVIAVFDGTHGSSGYEVAIQSITQKKAGKYQVNIVKTEPSNHCGTASVLTSPYHIVAYTFDRPSGNDAPYIEWAPPSASDFKFAVETRTTDCSD